MKFCGQFARKCVSESDFGQCWSNIPYCNYLVTNILLLSLYNDLIKVSHTGCVICRAVCICWAEGTLQRKILLSFKKAYILYSAFCVSNRTVDSHCNEFLRRKIKNEALWMLFHSLKRNITLWTRRQWHTYRREGQNSDIMSVICQPVVREPLMARRRSFGGTGSNLGIILFS